MLTVMEGGVMQARAQRNVAPLMPTSNTCADIFSFSSSSELCRIQARQHPTNSQNRKRRMTMKHFRIFFLVSALAANLGVVQGTPAPQEAVKPAPSAATAGLTQKPATAPAPKPVDAISWVVGGVWTAAATKLAPGMQKIETRYQWSDNHAYYPLQHPFCF
jgi:hypothetical protein